MSCTDVRALLDDYVDGTLPARQRRRVDEHVGSCLPCRRELDGLRSLLEAAAGLPEERQPPRDLWPEIEGRLSRGRPPSVVRLGRPTRSERRLTWLALAAAAAGVALLSSALTLWMVGGRSQPEEAATLPPSPAVEAAPRPAAASLAADRELQSLRDELHRMLEERRGSLDPETVARVEENLRLLDEAVRDILQALMEDPGNRGLYRLLGETYRQERDLLQQLSRIPEV